MDAFKVKIVNVKAKAGWRILVKHDAEWQEWKALSRPDLGEWQMFPYRSRFIPPDFLTQRFMEVK